MRDELTAQATGALAGASAEAPGTADRTAGADSSVEALFARARAWMAEDPDAETREELATLIESGDTDALRDRFSGTLQFGTAGLRGELGAGPMRMNRAVVIRAAAGIASYVRAQRQQRPVAERLVVIGYDARHKSADFARDTAAVLTGAGLRAALLPEPLPTPVLAYAVRHLGAEAGIMVTASHNPPRDNGYKVYLGDGLQIVPPADGEIAAEIGAVGPLAEVPRPGSGWDVLGEEVLNAYLARTGAVLTEGSPRDVRVVHTAMHGVGSRTARLAFERAGFPTPVPVPQQADPDPDFSTVAFPNPEEPGAMDLAYATAHAFAEGTGDARDTGDTGDTGDTEGHGERADLVIANDPDADRCGVAVPDPSAEAGWRMLRGDQVGALLATHLIHKRARGTFATTIVSSSLLSRIAAAAGLPYEETLTGFKWLARVDGLRYGYEEALGYCVDPEGVRDKDGITAALLVAELAAELKQTGRTLSGLVDDIEAEYGVHATDQLSVRVEDLSLIADAMVKLRARPPSALGGLPVDQAEDLTRGSAELPPTDGLRYHLSGPADSGVGSGRVIVRPSGTEPKLKCYLEVVVPVHETAGLTPARELAASVLARIKDDLYVASGF